MIRLELFEEGLYDSGMYYAFRDKRTGLFVGYDGFDTDFSCGVSAFLKDHELLNEFNKKLITKTHPEIIELLTDKATGSKDWDRLGGFANLDIVRIEVEAIGRVFSPIALLNLIMNEEEEDEDTTG